MLETIAIFVLGLIPGMLSTYIVMAGILKVVQERHRDRPLEPPHAARLLHPYLQAQDFHYVEGLGYIVGDLSCHYNARSPYLRCALHPSDPCQGCPSYTALQFPDEQDNFPHPKSS